MGNTLTGQRIKDTYLGFIKTTDNAEVDATGKELTDGNGNDLDIFINTGGQLGFSSTPDFTVDAGSNTDAFRLPNGSTAQQPTGQAGIIRYNTTDSKLEYFDTGYKFIASENYVNTQITNLIDSAPGTLDTLNEIAAALNDDPNFNTTITNLINGKQATITGAATTITSSDLTVSRALISNSSGKVAVSSVTDTELGYVSGVTSDIQTQIDSKQATITGAATTIDDTDLTASKALISNSSGKVAVSSVTDTELGYVSGVTSSIQDQFDNLTDNNTTYTVSAVDSGDNAIIRLTGSDSSTDDVTLVAGSNVTLTPSGDNITIASTATGSGSGISWQSTLKTANFTATANEGYFVDVSSGSVTVTMPSSPSVGDNVGIVDVKGNSQTNAIIISSSNNIQGSSTNHDLSYERGAVNLVYSGSTDGWVVSSAANESSEALVTSAVTVDFVVVAGGGGGGGGTSNGNGTGGGGAGGYKASYNNEPSGGGASSLDSLSLSTNTNYTVTVGNGGSGGASSTNGSNGGGSTFATISTTGGGGGGKFSTTGSSGGSGGGGGSYNQNGGSGTTGQGFSGGNGSPTGNTNYRGGGGGGASTSGVAGGTSGNGGAGVASTITGSSVTRAGGGGGGAYNNVTAGSGGTGGGGAGGDGSDNGTAGTANTGGGGGGGGWNSTSHGTGGNGGKGVVIIRYPNSFTLTETTSPTVLTFTTATVGSDKVTTFTNGQNGTIQFT